MNSDVPPEVPGELFRVKDEYGTWLAVAPWLRNEAAVWAWCGSDEAGREWLLAEDVADANWVLFAYRAWGLHEHARAKRAELKLGAALRAAADGSLV